MRRAPGACRASCLMAAPGGVAAGSRKDGVPASGAAFGRRVSSIGIVAAVSSDVRAVSWRIVPAVRPAPCDLKAFPPVE
ncbi:hypothetical protein GCM10018777_58670 [Streptomyces albogriseolus]|nr:hypothetical protein GCM10018777_58670 [Streptomyces viridodiastaticus]